MAISSFPFLLDVVERQSLDDFFQVIFVAFLVLQNRVKFLLGLGAASGAARTSVGVVAFEKLVGSRQRMLLIQVRAIGVSVVVVEVIDVPARRSSAVQLAVFPVQRSRRRSQHVGEVRGMFHAFEQSRIEIIERIFLAIFRAVVDDRHAFTSRSISQFALHCVALEAIRSYTSLHELRE